MIVRRLLSDELYHHGIKGQRWGIRRFQKKNFIERARDKRKMKRLREAKVQKKAEKDLKEKIINSGDKKQIRKIQAFLTDEEMERAVKRIAFNEAISDAKENKRAIDKATSAIDKYSNTVANIGKYAETVSKIAKAIDNVNKLKKGLNLGDDK